jgi:hypothetical protein
MVGSGASCIEAFGDLAVPADTSAAIVSLDLNLVFVAKCDPHGFVTSALVERVHS